MVRSRQRVTVKGRLWRLGLLAAAGLLAALARLAWLQVIAPDENIEDESLRRQYYSVPVQPFRGGIVARGGEVLAADRLAFDVTAAYRDLLAPAPKWLAAGLAGGEALGVDLAGARRALAERAPAWSLRLAAAASLGLDDVERERRAILDRVRAVRERVLASRPGLAGRRDFRVKEETQRHAVLSNVDLEVAGRVEARPEVYRPLTIAATRRRVYPMGRLACHVVGRLGVVEQGREPPAPPGAEVEEDKRYLAGDEIGVQGIEKQYDWKLRGARGLRWFRRQPAPAQDAMEQEAPARPGLGVELALDVAAQRAAEQALEGRGGAAVVMDVETGEVLVCASSPGYDLNLDGAGLAALFDAQPGPFVNRAIQAPAPGGSVVKIATAVAGLQSGKIGPGTRFTCEGAYYVGQWRFGCSAHHGAVSLEQAIEHSCNVYFFHAARATGPEVLAGWARSLGLGRLTGVDLPFEHAGRFPDPLWAQKTQNRPWYLGNTLNTCIGQGDVQVTPMQVAVMMAAVANGGRVLRPRLARGSLGQDGRRVVDSPEVLRQLPLEVSGLEAIRRGMRDVTRTGTAHKVEGLAELRVAGKSGTAQTRDRRINHAWFAGYAPWDHPRYAFAVTVQFVEAGGAEGAGPAALEALRHLLSEKAD